MGLPYFFQQVTPNRGRLIFFSWRAINRTSSQHDRASRISHINAIKPTNWEANTFNSLLVYFFCVTTHFQKVAVYRRIRYLSV